MMDEIQDKLDMLLNHLLDRSVEEVFVENDVFTIIFDNGTLLELYSEDGSLDLYFEIGQESPVLH